MIIFLPFVAIAIKLDSRGPVFFTQLRVGQHGRLFQMIKFRTMCHNAEKMIDKQTFNEENNPFIQSENDDRVTCVGKFLRRFSIDELPQVFCILKGDMSFIGPRAWIQEEIQKLKREELYRLVVKPGAYRLRADQRQETTCRSMNASKKTFTISITCPHGWISKYFS